MEPRDNRTSPSSLEYERTPPPLQNDAAFHRAVGRVVITFVTLPIGVLLILAGASSIDTGRGHGLFSGPEFVTAGLIMLSIGLIVVAASAWFAIGLFGRRPGGEK